MTHGEPLQSANASLLIYYSKYFVDVARFWYTIIEALKQLFEFDEYQSYFLETENNSLPLSTIDAFNLQSKSPNLILIGFNFKSAIMVFND